jgi:DNA topoisomerase I
VQLEAEAASFSRADVLQMSDSMPRASVIKLLRRRLRAKSHHGTRLHAVASAEIAGLRYVSDRQRGIARRKGPGGFVYIGADGKVIRNRTVLDRIRALAVPPAWTDVWICSDPRGHIQATGRDAKQRKQYRYHAAWHAFRDETKFDRMEAFARALPLIRRRTRIDLAQSGLPRSKVLATIVQLLEKSLIRVGNEEYARQNRSFGLTTLRNRHVQVNGGTLRFQFRGKSGVRHSVGVNDRRLARVVKQCRDLAGQELFQYLDEAGEAQGVDSGDINRYLQDMTCQAFTAKDFRTWWGTVLAVAALREFRTAHTKTQAEKNVLVALDSVSNVLGNTRAVCRKSYVHPGVIDCYATGSMLKLLGRSSRAAANKTPRLSADEVALVTVLKYLARRTPARRKAA